ncbi:helix-turn-helix domain-containing protein [Vibrio bathopelagicus]|uniref:helix-turn-helix domain-containing protein n=1 Tax=Vibrio bathopelagicus TaxID=2777577 RepID=UPI0018655216|nr:helix-turn-helix domain-containing protein [Vibrio bathopelagicus]
MLESQHLGIQQRLRSLSTSDADELAMFQSSKNRSYTKLASGAFHVNYIEVNLDDVQIFTENLNVGARIQAAPASHYLPFAAIVSEGTQGNFYGCPLPDKPFIQATGGEWDIQVSNRMQYVCSAFNRERLYTNYYNLTGREFPQEWLSSRVTNTSRQALARYSHGIQRILILVRLQPTILIYPSITKLLSDAAFNLLMGTLLPTLELSEDLAPFSKRTRGTRKAIEFISEHAHQVPTVPELCAVAALSERSLQYGFKELLGVTPIKYLRIVRLNGAHRDLSTCLEKGDPRVVDVALKWGFLELGRFAKEYAEFFNELPSETLRHKKW